MRNEFTKRLKGLMALVLCFGMLFGNSLMVFAGSNDKLLDPGIGDAKKHTKIDEEISTGSGGVVGSSSENKHYGGQVIRTALNGI